MKPSHKLVVAALFTCLATVATGWIQGRLSNRWGEPADLVTAGEQLAQVPTRVGEWQMQSSRPFEDEVLQMLRCAGHFTRVYKNVLTGELVTVALLVGPPGPTAVHTPEICYSSRGQTIAERPKPISTHRPQAADETLWRMVFVSNSVEKSRFSVVYGWCGEDGEWRAATRPRFVYGGAPLLYKIQLVGALTERSDQDSSDACQRFLQDFLPALDRVLFHGRAANVSLATGSPQSRS